MIESKAYTIKIMIEELSTNEIAELLLKELTELGAIYRYHETKGNTLSLDIALAGKFDVKIRYKNERKSNMN